MNFSNTSRTSSGSEESIERNAIEAELYARARSGLTFNSPLSGERADALAAALGGGTILDLGCGRGELLRRAVARNQGARGIGVDLDEAELAAAGGERIELHVADIAAWRERADAVVAIGVSHAWGGTAPMLRALRGLAPRALIGEGFWARSPDAAALRGLGASEDELGTLDELLAAVREAGFDIADVQCATLAEWDAFEAGWRAGLGSHPLAEERRRGYEEGYRGTLGFAYVVAQASS
jgi:SAM-dependent methyltransferase